MQKFTKELFMNALARMIWTFVEVALGFFAVGMSLSDIPWAQMFSVATAAAIASFLKSLLVGMPESQLDGTLLIDDSGDTTKWLLQVDTDVDKVNTMKSIRLKVNPDAKLIQPSEEE